MECERGSDGADNKYTQDFRGKTLPRPKIIWITLMCIL
jgi:hypothetical protein